MALKAQTIKWLIRVSFALNLCFGVIVILKVLGRYANYRNSVTPFSSMQMNPRDGEPLNPRQCFTRPLEVSAHPNALMVVGDSITEYADWSALLPGWTTVNFGIRADWTDCVLYRLPDIIAVRPATILLMIGANDLINGRTVEATAANHWRIIAMLRKALPRTRILLSAVIPMRDQLGASVAPQSIVDLNRLLKNVAEDFEIEFIDSDPAMRDSSEKLRKELSFDGVHLTSAGYLKLAETWRKALERVRD